MSDNSGATLHQEAIMLDLEFRQLDRDYGLNFARRAIILKRIQEDELWAFLTRPDGKAYRSFNSWLESAAPMSERDCRYALSAIKELQDIPESDFKEMPRETIETLKLIPQSLREEYIEPAKTLRPDVFLQKVQTEQPNLHLERRRAVRIKPEESDQAVIEEAIKIATEEAGGGISRGKALWAICVEYVMNHRTVVDDSSEENVVVM